MQLTITSNKIIRLSLSQEPLSTETEMIKERHGSNQGRSAKRRRPESAASGSAQPPPKDDDQSLKKPRESNASASKQHPALTSTGWQITDTRDDVVNSLMHMLPNNPDH
ncbi:hypothetical protein Tco_1119083 [Tanacetum coccineum]